MSNGEARNLRVTVASGDALDVRSFHVEERIGAPFHVEIVARSANASIDLDAVVGREASFTLETGTSSLGRTWEGHCNELELVGAEPSGLSTYRLAIVPKLWFASQRRNYRIFQQLSEPEIVTKLLGEQWGIEPVLRIDASRYKKRKIRVQYRESDFAFVSRMLEDAGIALFFEHEGGASRVVLSDTPASATPGAALRHHANWSGSDHTEERVATAVRLSQRVRPRKYTIKDHDYRRPPSYDLSASSKAEAGSLEDAIERFHHAPGAFLFASEDGEATPVADDKGRVRADEGEGRALAERRLHAKRGSARTCAFETNAHELGPGSVAQIVDHPHAEVGSSPWLVVASTLRGAHDGAVHHAIVAQTTAVPFRPRLATPRPRARGVESATVVGPQGEEIHTDEFGRVRVHFHWDRYDRMDDGSSCWLHVSQPWAGSGFGAIHLPRIGQEVLVGFLDGDPDRPVVVGRLFTALQAVPYKLPENKTQSGWRSQSTPGGGGFNEIMMEDAAGKELLNVQAQKDLTKLVKNNEDIVVGNNRDELIKNDHALTVGKNQQQTIGVNRATRVGEVDTVEAGTKILTFIQPKGGSPTSVTMVDGEIVLDTGKGARIEMKDDAIKLIAHKIEILAEKELLGKTNKGDLKLVGGPMVKVNC